MSLIRNWILTTSLAAVMVICPVGVHADQASSEGQVYERWGRILVLPFFDMTAMFGTDASLRGPLTRQVFVTDTVAEEAGRSMGRMVERHLAQKKGLRWDAPIAANEFSVPDLSANHDDHLAKVVEKGRQRGADHVLAGYLYAYRMREGGDYGVRKPAKVVFEMAMVQVATKRVIWHKRFDETQQALSENLLNLKKFIRRKGRWISAHEMADQAIEEMLANIFAADSTRVKPSR